MLATLAALAVRCFRLDAHSLWVDEVLTWYSAGIGRALTLRDLLENVHGPLYSLMLHAWAALAGDSEWALRLPSVLFGAAMVPALAWVAGLWIGREAMIPSAWLAAGSPFLVWYSQEARNYALLILCATLACGALLALRPAPGARRVARYAALAAAGMLTNFSFVLLAPLHLTWWLGPGPARVRRVGLLAAVLVLIALAAVPWIPQIARTWDWGRLQPARSAEGGESPLRGATTFHIAAVPFAAHAFAVGYTLGPSLRELRRNAGPATLRAHALEIAAVSLVFAVAAALGTRALARRGRLLDAALWLLVPVLIVSYFALQNFKVFHPRYIAVAFPLFLLLIAAGLADAGPRLRTALACAIGGLWLVSLHHLYLDPRYAKEDMRAAAALLRERGAPGEVVVAVHADDALAYYYRGPLPVRSLWLGFVARPARLEQAADQALAGANGAWVVLMRPEDLDPQGRFAPWLEARYPQAERFTTEGVQVWHVSQAGAAPAP